MIELKAKYIIFPLCCKVHFLYITICPNIKTLCLPACDRIRSDQLISRVRPFETPWIAARQPPCPSPTPRVHSDSRPSSQWCHPAISCSVVPFSSCPQSFPESESFPINQLFAICKASPDSHFAFLHFFSMGMVLSLSPVQCHEPHSIVHQALYLSDLGPKIYFSLPLYNHQGFDLGHTWMV